MSPRFIINYYANVATFVVGLSMEGVSIVIFPIIFKSFYLSASVT
jgi:hypothetical protein